MRKTEKNKKYSPKFKISVIMSNTRRALMISKNDENVFSAFKIKSIDISGTYNALSGFKDYRRL